MSTQYTSWAHYLPQGMTLETVYMYGAAMLVMLATFIVGKRHDGSQHNQSKNFRFSRAKSRAKRRISWRKTQKERQKKTDENIEFMQKVVQKLNLIQSNQKAEMTKLLVSAGYRSKNSLTKYAFAQGACAFGFMAFSLMFVKVDMTNLAITLFKICLPFIALYCGLYLPKSWLLTNALKISLNPERFTRWVRFNDDLHGSRAYSNSRNGQSQ